VYSLAVVDVYGIGVHIWDFSPVNIIGAHNVSAVLPTLAVFNDVEWSELISINSIYRRYGVLS
jgi:hypothetical protein